MQVISWNWLWLTCSIKDFLTFSLFKHFCWTKFRVNHSDLTYFVFGRMQWAFLLIWEACIALVLASFSTLWCKYVSYSFSVKYSSFSLSEQTFSSSTRIFGAKHWNALNCFVTSLIIFSLQWSLFPKVDGLHDWFFSSLNNVYSDAILYFKKWKNWSSLGFKESSVKGVLHAIHTLYPCSLNSDSRGSVTRIWWWEVLEIAGKPKYAGIRYVVFRLVSRLVWTFESHIISFILVAVKLFYLWSN